MSWTNLAIIWMAPTCTNTIAMWVFYGFLAFLPSCTQPACRHRHIPRVPYAVGLLPSLQGLEGLANNMAQLTYTANQQFAVEYRDFLIGKLVYFEWFVFTFYLASILTFFLAFYLASILTFRLAFFLAFGPRRAPQHLELACSTAFGAGDMVFGSRRAPQHPELAIWCSGPGVPFSIRSSPHGSERQGWHQAEQE